MATHKYNVERGVGHVPATEAVGSPISSGLVEVVVDLSVPGATKKDVLIAIDNVKRHITAGNWPPASP